MTAESFPKQEAVEQSPILEMAEQELTEIDQEMGEFLGELDTLEKGAENIAGDEGEKLREVTNADDGRLGVAPHGRSGTSLQEQLPLDILFVPHKIPQRSCGMGPFLFITPKLTTNAETI